jgi:hypothetical protein
VPSPWNGSGPIRRRQQVATALSRQAYRLDSQLPAIRAGAESWLGHPRCAVAIWQLASKQAEFGHLVAEGYKKQRYSAIAALVRTLFEDATLLAWMSAPNDSEEQTPRVKQVLLDYYREARNQGDDIPPDAIDLLKNTTGKAARRPPSWEDLVRQLDADERRKPEGIAFWQSHVGHVAELNTYVHSDLGGAVQFVDPRLRELVGFRSVVYGLQYLSLSIVSVVRLSNQNALATRAQAAFNAGHGQKMDELKRLF